MANRTISTRQRQKYDTAANWTTNNPVLLAGEIGIESDTGKLKAGDGTSTWSELEYLGGSTEIAPATEKVFGTVRAWVEDGYICFSTEEYISFVNSLSDGGALTIQGSQNVQQDGSVLTIS